MKAEGTHERKKISYSPSKEHTSNFRRNDSDSRQFVETYRFEDGRSTGISRASKRKTGEGSLCLAKKFKDFQQTKVARVHSATSAER